MFRAKDATMWRVNAILTLVMVLLVTVASESVFARGGGHRFGGPRVHLGIIGGAPAVAWHHGGGHVRFGVFVGPGFWYPPPYYGYPPYYYPPVVAAPSSPPVYIEQGDTQAAPEQPQGDWYYCADTQAYYPYVKECPGGWQRVAPQPPPG